MSVLKVKTQQKTWYAGITRKKNKELVGWWVAQVVKRLPSKYQTPQFKSQYHQKK
jgi:hypothetical protein